MMTESPFRDGIQYAWNATSISLAEQCLLKYKLVMLDGWQSRTESHHITFGAVFASSLERYFKYLFAEKSEEEALQLVVYDALTETWNRETGEPWQSFDSRKTRENLIRTIVWYFEHYKQDETKIIRLESGAPAVELTFAFEAEPGIVFSGHLDRLVEYQDQTLVMDQKTTGSTIGPAYWNQFNPHTQFSMYAFAGQVVYHTPVKGVLIDAAQIAVGFTRFERSITYRTKDQLDEWYGDTLWHIQLAQEATRNNRFPMNRAGCNMYGGCQFRGVCSRDPSVRPQFLKADFEQGTPMNPLERR